LEEESFGRGVIWKGESFERGSYLGGVMVWERVIWEVELFGGGSFEREIHLAGVGVIWEEE